MRAVLRLGFAVFAVGLTLAPLPALAQDATTATAPNDTPATDAVGPRDLQNFSLNGTVTKSAEPVAVSRPTGSRPAPQPPSDDSASAASEPQTARTAAQPTERSEVRPPVRTVTAEPTPHIALSTAADHPASKPSSSVTVPLPPVEVSPVSTATPAALAPPADALESEHRLLLWPWLLAALVLGTGGAFLFWRSHRSRESFAGGPQQDAFVAPEAMPSPPKPALAPAPKAAPAPPPGIVTTRLRPWIELAFQPGRCIVEDDKIMFEFELGLQNSGNAPARGVLVEASVMNAGPYQDQEVSAFYDAPVGEGERIVVIPPLKTVLVKTKVEAPRANVQLIEIAGRRVFVPLIAFNALYSWSTGEGQTSASYLLGRNTKGEKLGSFRLDLGPRIFRNVGARPLPIAVRK